MKDKSIILGIKYGGHDTSATLIINNKVVAACEQERFDLEKHSRAFPHQAIEECLNIAGIHLNEVDEISYGNDYLDMIRKVYLQPAIENKIRIRFLIDDIDRIERFYNMEKIIRDETGFLGPVNFYRHHLCHLASAYFPSGFKDALIVSYDGMGEIESAMIGVGRNGKIEIIDDTNHYPNSLGLFYSAITYFLGWKHHCDEGIIMGLAPFGDYNAKVPEQSKTYLEFFEEIIKEPSPLNFEIDLSWIEYQNKRDTWISNKFLKIFGDKRNYSDLLTQHHKNIAAALQKRTEDIILKQIKYLRKKFDIKYLCIAGGIGLNCSLNGKIASQNIFEEIFVQPASGDSGISLGAAYLSSSKQYPYQPSKYHNFYLGSRSSNEDILQVLKSLNVPYTKPKNLEKSVAKLLQEGQIVGWFQGAAEFGPRALGNRSILSKPFPEKQRDHINERVKFREEFRPFAPAVIGEYASDYFDIQQESPHMLIACKVKNEKKDKIPAVVHIDDTCRVQTVEKHNNERFYKLLTEFHSLTNCPVLLNTSFNIKGQPIVNTPKQAIESFLSINLDALAIGPFLLTEK